MILMKIVIIVELNLELWKNQRLNGSMGDTQ